VHTGEVVAYAGEASGKVEYRLIGHTANLASRMESIATPGAIPVSETTAKFCDGHFELRDLGPTTVKGVSTPVSIYEVLGRGTLRTHFELSARRGLTRFVGRVRELEQMRRALEQSIAGHGQIVVVVAEAGTGKSRLFYEFKATIPAAASRNSSADSANQNLDSRCSVHSMSTWLMNSAKVMSSSNARRQSCRGADHCDFRYKLKKKGLT
jgi:hypothetical protein